MPRKTKAAIAKEHVPHEFFAAFWKLYPRKVNKLEASIAFARIDPDDDLAFEIRKAVVVQSQFGCLCPKPDGDKSYIPHASTWLNQRRWEDELESAPQPRRDRQTDYAAATLLSALHSNGVGHAQPPAPQLPLPGRDGAEGG